MVGLGRVDVVDSIVDGVPDHIDGEGLVDLTRVAVEYREPHGPEAKSRGLPI